MIRGTKIEALGANVAVPAGAKVIDAAGADVYPGFINARTQMGLNEPGARGFEDVNEMLDLNPQLRTRGGLSLRKRRDRSGAHQRHHHRRGHARRRHVRRRSRGHESRWLDVGGSLAQSQLRHHVQLPRARRRGRARGRRRTRRRWRTRGRDVRRPQAHARSPPGRARAALRSGARVRESRPGENGRLDPRGPHPGGGAQAAAHHHRESRPGHQGRRGLRRSREGQHRHQRRHRSHPGGAAAQREERGRDSRQHSLASGERGCTFTPPTISSQASWRRPG